MAESLISGIVSSAAAGEQVVNIREDFKKIPDEKFVKESTKIVKAVCATIAGKDEQCDSEPGYTDRISSEKIILDYATDLLKDALSVDPVILIKFLTEYQTEEEKKKIIDAKLKEQSSNKSDGDNENCDCPAKEPEKPTEPDESEEPTDDDHIIEKIAVAVAAAASETNTIESSSNEQEIAVAVAAVAAGGNIMSGGGFPEIPDPKAIAEKAINDEADKALGDIAGVADIAGVDIPTDAADLAGAIPTDPTDLAGAAAAGAIPGVGSLLGNAGDINSADAAEILKDYTKKMISTIKCNQLVYAEIKTFIGQVYRFGKEQIQSQKLDIIKESLKSHSEYGRKKVNQTRISIYEQNLTYLQNVDTPDGIEAYIHIVDDMYPFLVLANLHENGTSPLKIIKQHVSKLKSKEAFKKVSDNPTFPDTLQSQELITELGFKSTTATKKGETNNGEHISSNATDISALIGSVFSGAGKKKRRKRTRKYRKTTHNRTR
jgi:hypothetical protein